MLPRIYTCINLYKASLFVSLPKYFQSQVLGTELLISEFRLSGQIGFALGDVWCDEIFLAVHRRKESVGRGGRGGTELYRSVKAYARLSEDVKRRGWMVRRWEGVQGRRAKSGPRGGYLPDPAWRYCSEELRPLNVIESCTTWPYSQHSLKVLKLFHEMPTGVLSCCVLF